MKTNLQRFNGDLLSVASSGNQRGHKNQYSSGDRPAIALKFLKNNQLFFTNPASSLPSSSTVPAKYVGSASLNSSSLPYP
ncbi:hypothetical protein PALU110988_10980 [Paenibacillus lupini]